MLALGRNLIKWAVKLAHDKPLPDTTPLSGEDRLKARDYYEVSFRTTDREQCFLSKDYHDLGMTGMWFQERTGKGQQASLSFVSLSGMKFYIRHYFRRYEIEYHSPISFLIGTLTLKKYRVWFGDRVGQFFFNRKTLTRSSRLQLLEEIVENSLSDRRFVIDEITYFYRRFGSRVHFHPEASAERRYLGFILESLVDTGDLKKVPNGYQVTGRAFSTISQAEQEDRKHQENVTMQRILAVLTLCLVVVGALQVSMT